MNSREINKKSIIEYLASLGIYPAKKYYGYYMYYSPFRPHEKTPSLKVSGTNLWVDYGDDNQGGTLLDLMLRLNPSYNVKNIINRLEEGDFSFHQPNVYREINKGNKQQIIKVKALANPILLDYLTSRKLNVSLCKKYCGEIIYRINCKRYFGVSFRNESGGYEVRNKYAKVCLGRKDITIFQNGFDSCMVFESWSDFVAFLTLHPHVENSNDFIILNSTAMLNRVIERLGFYKKVFVAFDNDESGRKASSFLATRFPENVVFLNRLYAAYKDVNELLENI